MMKKCVVCSKTGEGLKQCGRCKNVYYCSIEHQRADWARHKPICHKVEKKVPSFHQLHAPLPGSWDAKYIGGGHGGVTVGDATSFPSFSKTGVYSAEKNQTRWTVSLLNISGIGVIKDVQVTFSRPLMMDATLEFTKADMENKATGERSHASIELKTGTAQVNLMTHRTLFVAYLDCLVQPLEIILHTASDECKHEPLVSILVVTDRGLGPEDVAPRPLGPLYAVGEGWEEMAKLLGSSKLVRVDQ